MYHLSALVYILSAVVWVGGMLFLALVAVPVARRQPAAERSALIGALDRRFRVVGWVCIALLLVTGTGNTDRTHPASTASRSRAVSHADHADHAGRVVWPPFV